MMCRHALFCILIPTLPLLAACENSATSMVIENKDHALVLIREQPHLWSNEVEQYIVVSRLPDCQRRVKIHPDRTMMTPMTVYEMGHLLWALNQGEDRWYLVSTEGCQVQDWDNLRGRRPGVAVGSFEQRDGKNVFTVNPGP